jgi:hypothetical protein
MTVRPVMKDNGDEQKGQSARKVGRPGLVAYRDTQNQGRHRQGFADLMIGLPRMGAIGERLYVGFKEAI